LGVKSVSRFPQEADGGERPDPEAVNRGDDFDMFQEHMRENEPTRPRNFYKREMRRLVAGMDVHV
jgi:hypothetical protein